MNRFFELGSEKIPVYTYDTIILGSGAAGLAAAERLFLFGQKSIALVTEHMNAGTSRNTGSDKQTYYKLTLSGGQADSVHEMAETLMSGGCVDGDLALCEAALSPQCFYHLVELGVPFPCSRYGEYVGYKTDHDPRTRAASAGPYTSKMMTEALETSVRQKGINTFSHMQAVRILTDGQRVLGLLCLNLENEDGREDASSHFAIFQCINLILATGGPAGIYRDSVYPYGHHGSTGLAFEAGAAGKNLTEWQYGLSSLKPRWNVSGTYMQALPRFISREPDGGDEKEFLSGYFEDDYEMLNYIFLKGYQWPFDVRKVSDGSSIIDILVYMETQKGRRVFLDYTRNPCGGIDFDRLPDESRTYLQRGNACLGTPYDRLVQMNEPAAAFYRDRGVDLSKEPLEIALCAQHNNGGLSVDCWWQTSIDGLFCIGEAAGSHGVYRPGGTALNAGQVGALRAAQRIAFGPDAPVSEASAPFVPLERAREQVEQILAMEKMIRKGRPENISALTADCQKQMSLCAAAFRRREPMEKLLQTVTGLLDSLPDLCCAATDRDVRNFFLLRDILLCQQAYLFAMADYISHGGSSRGSALYPDEKGQKPDCLPDDFRFVAQPESETPQIQEILCRDQHFSSSWRDPRPIPEEDDFFENVWKQYRINRNVY